MGRLLPQWLVLVKAVLKEYVDLRSYIRRIPEERLDSSLKKNEIFMNHLFKFHQAVLHAWEPFEFVSELPPIAGTKHKMWMSKAMLDPDVTAQNLAILKDTMQNPYDLIPLTQPGWS